MSKKNILIALRLGYSSNRNYLSGIARHMHRAADWRATVEESFSDFTPDRISRIADDRYDGIVTVQPHDSAARLFLERTTVPLVVIGASRSDLRGRKKNLIVLQGDDVSYGELAARHFALLGRFRSYAFVPPSKPSAWADRRLRGFSRSVARQGGTVTVIRSPHRDGSPDDIRFLREALSDLPKPLAVLGAYDARAMNVLQACEAGELSVPKAVSVMGMDDDPVFCDFARPPLTSISMGQVRVGEIAAMELNRLIETRPQPTRTIVTRNAEVVVRESTAPVSPSSHLVERAIALVNAEAAHGISARDVIARLGVSRALADRRFRELQGVSIGQAILRRRLSLLRQKLRNSRLPIATVSAACGFATPDHANRMFRKAFGLSLRDYRRQQA